MFSPQLDVGGFSYTDKYITHKNMDMKKMTKKDKELKEYKDYAQKIVKGDIPAGELLKLTCQRYLDWFDRDDFYFDVDSASRPVKFIQKLKFWEGAQFKGKPFILQDW